MKLINHFIIISLLNYLLSSCMKGKEVDQIFHNASVICMDDEGTTGEAIAIKNGEIIEIGPERQILNKYRAEVILDVEGKVILPTFTDCKLDIDTLKKWNSNLLENIEYQELEQGIAELYTHGLSYKQLLELEKFEPRMQLKWHIYLSPSRENMEYIRRKKISKTKNKNLIIAGFTVSNQDKSTILEACSIAKNKFLQIGMDYNSGKKNIPLVIQSLQNFRLDHRWFVFNMREIESKTVKLLQENNFFLCLNKNNKITFPIYLFGTIQPTCKLLDDLIIYSELNHLDVINTLKSITNWAHYLSFSEKLDGTLEKGKKANFTILESPIGNRKINNAIYANRVYQNGKEIYSME